MISTANSIDVVVVGAGIAGCCLTRELLKRGCTVRLLDDRRKASSLVAGGVINPVSGKRFGMDPGFQEAMALAHEVYDEIEGALRPIEILRCLSDADEKRHFERKSEQLLSSAWIRRLSNEEWQSRVALQTTVDMADPLICVSGASVLNMPLVLAHFHQEFARQSVLIECAPGLGVEVAHSKQLQGLSVGSVVFAEGWRLQNNPFFDYVPRMFAKGQVVELEFATEHGLNDIVMLHSKFLLPLSPTRCLYGATYEWNRISDEVEQETNDFLFENFLRSVTSPARIVQSRAGVRPIVADLKPVLGAHPLDSSIYILNGLGSKGALQGPLCGRLLSRHMLDGAPLPANLSIARFEAQFSASSSLADASEHSSAKPFTESSDISEMMFGRQSESNSNDQ